MVSMESLFILLSFPWLRSFPFFFPILFLVFWGFWEGFWWVFLVCFGFFVGVFCLVFCGSIFFFFLLLLLVFVFWGFLFLKGSIFSTEGGEQCCFSGCRVLGSRWCPSCSLCAPWKNPSTWIPRSVLPSPSSSSSSTQTFPGSPAPSWAPGTAPRKERRMKRPCAGGSGAAGGAKGGTGVQ